MQKEDLIAFLRERLYEEKTKQFDAFIAGYELCHGFKLTATEKQVLMDDYKKWNSQ